MALLDYVELAIAKCFPIASPNPHDEKLFRKGLAFASVPEPSIDVECAEVGPSGSTMLVEQTQVGTSRFPSLTWKTNLQGIKEYILVSEDPDGPFPTPIVHGIYYNIPAEKAGVDNDDFTAKSGNELQGGFKYGKNLRGTIYSGPKPLLTHGPHRYEYTIIGLSEPLDPKQFPATPARDEIAKAIEGKVLGWGHWVGVFERKWE